MAGLQILIFVIAGLQIRQDGNPARRPNPTIRLKTAKDGCKSGKTATARPRRLQIRQDGDGTSKTAIANPARQR